MFDEMTNSLCQKQLAKQAVQIEQISQHLIIVTKIVIILTLAALKSGNQN